MTDISPALLEAVRKEFDSRFKTSSAIAKFTKKVGESTAGFTDLNDYSYEVGKILSDSFRAVIKDGVLPDNRMYWNIAKAVVEPMLRQNVDYVNDAAVAVQSIEDAVMKVGLKGLKVDANEEYIEGILNSVSAEDLEIEEINQRLDQCTNFTQRTADDYIQKNAEVRSNSGYKTAIIRKATFKCCEWCQSLTGSYDYPSDTPDDIFRRHENCRCTVIYKSGKTYQDVYSKQTYDKEDIATSQQSDWLAKYDDNFKTYLNNQIKNVIKQKGVSEEKATDIVNANKQKYLSSFKYINSTAKKKGKYTADEMADYEKRQQARKDFVDAMEDKGWSRKEASIYFDKNQVWLTS